MPPVSILFDLPMKKLLTIAASMQCALGQETVVLDSQSELGFEIADFGLEIGIVPVDDYYKANAEIYRLRQQLQGALCDQAAKIEGAGAREKSKEIEALRAELTKSYQEKEARFLKREKAAELEIANLERKRAEVTARLQRRLMSLREGLGKQEGEWEERINLLEEERDEAQAKVAEAEQKRLQDHQAWVKAVESWRAEVEASTRAALMKGTQEAVANTAKLAKEWQSERAMLEGKLVESEERRMAEVTAWGESVAAWEKKTIAAVRAARMEETQQVVADTAKLAKEWQGERTLLEGRLIESEERHAREIKAWEEAVASWEKKTVAAVRAAKMEETKKVVSDTARLAASWQEERAELEAQVEGLLPKLAKLEAALGMKGQEKKRAEELSESLGIKSKALEKLSFDAAQMAKEWKSERESARRELEAMRNLYKSTARDVSTRDQRIKKLEKTLASRTKALSNLTDETEKLAESWVSNRGGLQQKIADLEEQVSLCDRKLQAALKREKTSSSQAKALSLKTNQFEKDFADSASRLTEQSALVASLKTELAGMKKSELQLKNGLGVLKKDMGKLQESAISYREQRAKDQEEIANLQAQLKQVEDRFAASQRELKEARKTIVLREQEIEKLQLEASKLNEQLVLSQKEVVAAKQEANGFQRSRDEAQAESEAQEKKVTNLENEMGRLSVVQQELEGALATAQGDYKKLETSHLELKALSADGGKLTEKAMLARQKAESELKDVKENLRVEKMKLEEARNQLQEAVKKRKAAEAEAEAGKAALGKFETELKGARQEVAALQLGNQSLVKEAEELRKRFVQIQPVRYQLASANVVAQQQRVLAEVNQVMEVFPDARFSIKGHTCNIGRGEDNLKLSEDRAKTLRDFLVSNGIEESRIIHVEGYGDTEPQANNDTDEGRRQNRRVDIEVVR